MCLSPSMSALLGINNIMVGCFLAESLSCDVTTSKRCELTKKKKINFTLFKVDVINSVTLFSYRSK